MIAQIQKFADQIFAEYSSTISEIIIPAKLFDRIALEMITDNRYPTESVDASYVQGECWIYTHGGNVVKITREKI